MRERKYKKFKEIMVISILQNIIAYIDVQITQLFSHIGLTL